MHVELLVPLRLQKHTEGMIPLLQNVKNVVSDIHTLLVIRYNPLHACLQECRCTVQHNITVPSQSFVSSCAYTAPLTSTWPHLRCDVGLEEGVYRENCLCLAVLCTIIMVHKDTSSSYRSVNCIGL